MGGSNGTPSDEVRTGPERAQNGGVSTQPLSIRDYQLLRKLGQGGMSNVYLARHTRLHRDVAIKLLPADLAADPQFRGRIEREMAVIGRMEHPQLVHAHHAGLKEGRLIL